MLADQTNRQTRSASGAPPGLTSCLARAQVAPSTVSTAQVMCRSAPASRSSSRVGDNARSGLSGARNAPVSARSEAYSFSSSRPSKSDGVPLLASTCVENDAWSTHWVNGHRVPMTVASPSDDGDNEMYSGGEDEDDDEGELTLARLLVPPKRQYSIQSLRKHLHHSQSRSNLRERENPWDEDGGTLGAVGRAMRSPTDDEDGEGYGWQALGMPGFKNGTVKSRSGIPGGWANFTNRS